MVVKYEDNSLVQGIEIINKKANFASKNITVIAKLVEEQGFRVEKTAEKEFIIEYSEKVYFFNALSLLASGKEVFERREYTPKLGLMLDCARNAVPTIDFLKEYLLDAVLMGYNYLGLYLEDLLNVPEERFFGWKRGKYSQTEIKSLIDYADIFGVEIVPYMQTLAHLDAMFRCQFWDDLDKIHDFKDALLIGEERTYQFLDALLRSVANTFKTKTVHIGMDEAWMVGRGVYLDRHGYANRTELIVSHLEKVLDICEKYKLEPQMWADMFVYASEENTQKIMNDEKMLNILSRVTLTYWNYHSPDENEYLTMLEKTSKFSPKYCFAGGAWGFVGLTPLNAYGIDNIQASMSACRKMKVMNVVVTQWGDLSAEGSFYSTIPTIVRAMNYFVDGGLTHEDENNLLMFLYNYTFDELMETDLPNSVKDNVRNNTAFCLMANDVLLDLMGLMACPDYDEKYKKITNRLSELAERESKISYVFDTLAKMTCCLEIKSVLTLKLKEAYKAGKKEELLKIAENNIPELVSRLKIHLKSMWSQWLKEKKSFGLDNVNMRISAGICQLEYALDIIRAYVKGDISCIAEFDEPDYKYFYFWGDEDYRDRNLVVYTDWYNMVSNSRFHFSNHPYSAC